MLSLHIVPLKRSVSQNGSAISSIVVSLVAKGGGVVNGTEIL